jgi:hypothetical protein
MLFSERRGIKPIKSLMQVDSLDGDARTALWNAFIPMLEMRETP